MPIERFYRSAFRQQSKSNLDKQPPIRYHLVGDPAAKSLVVFPLIPAEHFRRANNSYERTAP
jgi:hypothetical protein